MRSSHGTWTALILWKINLRAAKSWFDSPSSDKVKFSPSNFLVATCISALKCPFRCLLGKSWSDKVKKENLSGRTVPFLQIFRAFKFPSRMLIGNFGKSLVCSEAVAPLFKNSHVGSFFGQSSSRSHLSFCLGQQTISEAPFASVQTQNHSYENVFRPHVSV